MYIDNILDATCFMFWKLILDYITVYFKKTFLAICMESYKDKVIISIVYYLSKISKKQEIYNPHQTSWQLSIR